MIQRSTAKTTLWKKIKEPKIEPEKVKNSNNESEFEQYIENP